MKDTGKTIHGTKYIPGYENLYSITPSGGVYSHMNNRWIKGSMSNGYIIFQLSKDGIKKHMRRGRVIALTYIPNPNNFPVVNHIDGNKLNDVVENLEWCTQGHNSREAWRLGLSKNYRQNPPRHLICEYCSKNFIRYTDGEKSYCSRRCYSNSRRRIDIDRVHYLLSQGYTQKMVAEVFECQQSAIAKALHREKAGVTQ